MPVSMFETRKMLELLKQAPKPKTFLRDLLFRKADPSTEKKLDVDIVKGTRRMAPFVSPRLPGKTMERQGWKVETYEPPLLKPKIPTLAEDFLNRSPGEGVYGAKSPEERAAEMLGKDFGELEDIITRREEWMCAQALFTGSIHMVGDGIDEDLSFGHTQKVTLSAGSRWSESTGDPLGDLRAFRRTISKASGISANVAILSAEAVDALLENPNVAKLLDLRKVEIGQIDPQQLPNGAVYYGYIKDVGIDLYGYDEWFLDEDGNEKPMVPEKKVLLTSTQARFDLLYGCIVDADQGAFAVERFPRSWTEKDPSVRWVQTQSKPLPVPHQVDAFLVAEVV